MHGHQEIPEAVEVVVGEEEELQEEVDADHPGLEESEGEGSPSGQCTVNCALIQILLNHIDHGIRWYTLIGIVAHNGYKVIGE